MPAIIPNFHFDGCCRQALDLYREALGAEITTVTHYSDAKPEDFSVSLTEEQKKYVYHAEMKVSGQRLMFSDAISPIDKGQNLSIVVVFPGPEEVRESFALLRDGGKVLFKPSELTYSSCFAAVIDRFGMRWELMTENP